MSRPDGRPVDVELVEDDAQADVPSPAQSWRSRAAAVPRRVRVSAAVLVAVGVVSVGAGQLAERTAVSARLAEVDGLSVSLARPLVEAWSSRGSQAIGVTGGAVLVQEHSRPGGEALTAVDAVTGDVRWSLSGRCQPAVDATAGTEYFPGASRVPELAGGDLLMCAHDTGGHPDGGHAGSVTSHDPVTGALLRTIVLDPLSSSTTSVLGTDLVSAGTEQGGRVRAGRWSLRTGERVWDYRSPDTPAGDPAQGVGVGFSVSVDAVLVQVGSWEVVLDPVTGVPHPERDGGDAHTFPWGPVELPDGARAVGRFVPDGPPQITVEDVDGATRFTTDGFLLPPPAVDDGTGPPTVLVMDPESAGMVALDAASGRERWRSGVSVGDRAVLAGLVLVTDGSSTTALDAWTGETRWESETDLTTSWALISDGRRVLTVEAGEAGAVLVARDVETGETAWTMDSPVGSAGLRLLPGGTVLATGATGTDGMVALRAP